MRFVCCQIISLDLSCLAIVIYLAPAIVTDCNSFKLRSQDHRTQLCTTVSRIGPDFRIFRCNIKRITLRQNIYCISRPIIDLKLLRCFFSFVYESSVASYPNTSADTDAGKSIEAHKITTRSFFRMKSCLLYSGILRFVPTIIAYQIIFCNFTGQSSEIFNKKIIFFNWSNLSVTDTILI